MGLSELIQRYQPPKNTLGNTKNTKENLGVPAGSRVVTGWNTKNTKNTTFNRSPFSAFNYQECKALSLRPPHALLIRVANLLGVTGDYLLEQGFLEPCDLEEQAATDPWVLAEGIRLDPRWRKPPIPEKQMMPPEPVGQGEPQAHTTHWTAHIAPAEWLKARDAYLNHLAACPECWAPIKRYCPMGTQLQAQYQEVHA